MKTVDLLEVSLDLNSLSRGNHVYINFTCPLGKTLGQLRKKSQLRDLADQTGL